MKAEGGSIQKNLATNCLSVRYTRTLREETLNDPASKEGHGELVSMRLKPDVANGKVKTQAESLTDLSDTFITTLGTYIVDVRHC
jgi:hypothetical protein